MSRFRNLRAYDKLHVSRMRERIIFQKGQGKGRKFLSNEQKRELFFTNLPGIKLYSKMETPINILSIKEGYTTIGEKNVRNRDGMIPPECYYQQRERIN